MTVNKSPLLLLLLAAGMLPGATASAQKTLSLKEAVQTATRNYGAVKAKANYARASQAAVSQAKRDYLPNLVVAFQADYGTINGANGPLYPFTGYSVASAGPMLASQNWNAAFGSLYLTNINWDVFAFGRAKEKVNTATAAATRDSQDLQQEIFQQQVKVAAAYLNLLAVKRLIISYQKNLDRANAIRNVVVARAKNNLSAGVDSSQANAEVSSARIALTNATDQEQALENELARLMGVPDQGFVLDTLFISGLPKNIASPGPQNPDQNPLLKFYRSRILYSDAQARYCSTFYYPTVSVAGVWQSRGTGFDVAYPQNPTAFSADLGQGLTPIRGNYLLGLGVSWNLTQPLRISEQVKAQRYISLGLQDEYNQASLDLKNQLLLSDNKIKNALNNYREAPVQVQAASDAYRQKTTLYGNGLTNLVDVTQTLYLLVRAETDRDIANNNVWQALLYKAAASGDMNLFLNNF